jgi:hypothetical protein
MIQVSFHGMLPLLIPFWEDYLIEICKPCLRSIL